MISQYSQVRLVALHGAPDTYDGYGVNRRVPQVGDVGTVVEIMGAESGETMYVVECVNDDGSTEWIGDFVSSELEAHET
jgi:hypothetical protein